MVVTGGIIASLPFFIYGISVDQPAEGKPFLPSRESFRNGCRTGFWNAAMVVTFLLPAAIPIVGFLTIPSGDNWPVVAERIGVVVAFVGAFYWWIGRCKVNFEKWFRGRATDAFVTDFTTTKPPEPFKWQTFLWNQSWLLIASALGFAIFFRLIDLNVLKLNLDGPRRLRGFVYILTWCRGNPNTVATSSLLAAIGCAGGFCYQMFTSLKHRDRSA